MGKLNDPDRLMPLDALPLAAVPHRDPHGDPAVDDARVAAGHFHPLGVGSLPDPDRAVAPVDGDPVCGDGYALGQPSTAESVNEL